MNALDPGRIEVIGDRGENVGMYQPGFIARDL